MVVTVLAIDLAKHVFELYGADLAGNKVVSRRLKRSALEREVLKLRPEIVAFEAGGGAHQWGRRFRKEGLTVRMISPQYVKPFRVGSSKDDAADARAIAMAALQPSVPTVAVKELWQQDVQFMHRIRQDLVERRTALCNQYRGFLVECGLVTSQSPRALVDFVRELSRELEHDEIPPRLFRWLSRFLEQFRQLEAEIELITGEIESVAAQNPAVKRIMAIPGIGVLGATALIAAAGDGQAFKNGRQFAAWIGLVPRRVGTGGKSRMLGISKRGDSYLRMLLIHGGRSLTTASKRRPDHAASWVKRLVAEKPPTKAAVAIANRNARLAWRLLAKNESYDARKVAA